MRYCTLSPEGFFGVEWSLSCQAHDGQYRIGQTLGDKVRADLALSQDVWSLASLADAAWKQAAIRVYSVGMFMGTSTVGYLFWLRARICH